MGPCDGGPVMGWVGGAAGVSQERGKGLGAGVAAPALPALPPRPGPQLNSWPAGPRL